MSRTRTKPAAGPQFRSFFRGAFIGIIGVAAIAVWAINLEIVLAGKAPGGLTATLVRVILCDAIPLATLIAIFRGIASDHTAEGFVRSIVNAVFWFTGKRRVAAEPLRFHDEREHAD
jgi:hypothetical protein